MERVIRIRALSSPRDSDISGDVLIRHIHDHLRSGEDQEIIDVRSLVYRPKVLKYLFENMVVPKSHMYSMLERSIERGLVESYRILTERFAEYGLPPKHLRIRPYLMNRDLLDAAVVAGIHDPVRPRQLGPFETKEKGGYFGYRKTWYFLVYEPESRRNELIRYWRWSGNSYDCTYTASYHYLLWRTGVPTEEWDRHDTMTEEDVEGRLLCIDN